MDKRFKFNGATNCIEYDGKSILLDSYGEDIEELLNELHEENQKCKEYNGKLYANHTKTDRELLKQISELQKENEQLKRQIGNLEHTKDFCAEVCADCERLENENEQLRKEIEDLKQALIRCAFDR
jgi:chromosome segregation ATPase